MAATYQWASLRDARCTRLVTLLPGKRDSPIEIELTEVSLDDESSYEAVSYAWASAENPQTIHINKKPSIIRKNLHDFLVQLRAKLVAPQTRVLWIDALSISQNQLVEKGQQVAMIGDIFGQAERVLVWLGEHAGNSELVFRDDAGLHSYNPQHHSGMVRKTKLHYQSWKRSWKPKSVRLPVSHCCEPLSEQVEKSRADAWAHLLERVYWSRLWVVQEVAKAKSVVVFCGDRSRDWDDLVTVNFSVRYQSLDKISYFDGVAVSRKSRRGYSYAVVTTDKSATYPLVSLLIVSVGRLNVTRSETSCGADRRPISLIDNINRFCMNFKCQDRRDRVYALLSISSLPEDLRPDYTLGIPELFLRIYVLHYSDNSTDWTEKGILDKIFPFESWEYQQGFGIIERLFTAMSLSDAEICAVIDLLFAQPISHPPGSSEERYAAPILVAAQYHICDAQVGLSFEEHTKLWRRSYNKVMPLVRSNPRAAATEIVKRLRAELVATNR